MSTVSEYFRPKSVSEALEVLGLRRPGSAILAGGQSLLPLMKSGALKVSTVIDLGSLYQLDYIKVDGEMLHIGATTTQTDVASSLVASVQCPLVVSALSQAGSRLTRNRGTVGGSIANADPMANLCVALLAVNAKMMVAGRNKHRLVDAREFFLGLNRTCLEPDELLVEVQCPVADGSTGWSFLQTSFRPGEYGAASAAAVVVPAADGTVARCSVVAGGTLPFARRLPDVENFLAGKPPSDEVLSQCMAATAAALGFPERPECSIEYRRHATMTLLRRAIIEAANRASISTDRRSN